MEGMLYLSKKDEENGARIVMTHLPNRKNPCLAVQIDNCLYKVASFNDETTADWFIEILEEIVFGERRPKNDKG